MSKSRATTTRAADKAAIPAGGLAAMRRPPTHPGTIFAEDFLAHAAPAISQAEAARRLGWSANRMNEFVTGKRGVTAENAVALAELTGASPEFWMNLQTQRDLWHALQARRKQRAIEPMTMAR